MTMSCAQDDNTGSCHRPSPRPHSTAPHTLESHTMLRSRHPYILLAAISIVGSSVARSQTTKAFTGATLIDGTDRAPITNATIVVRDGRVVAAGPAASVSVPAGAERISLAGKTVIPGLV